MDKNIILKEFAEEVAKVLSSNIDSVKNIHFIYQKGFLGMRRNICRVQFISEGEERVRVIFEKKYPWKDFINLLRPIREKYTPLIHMRIESTNAIM